MASEYPQMASWDVVALWQMCGQIPWDDGASQQMYGPNSCPTQLQILCDEEVSGQMPQVQPILALPTAQPQQLKRKRRRKRKGKPIPRKTLTDEDRQQICQIHKDNPSVTQTETGDLFDVDRTTISKILTNKGKLLQYNSGGHPLSKHAERKFPNIGRALETWAVRAETVGMQLTGSAIEEKARTFAAMVGDENFLQSSEFEEFKRRRRVDGLSSPSSSKIMNEGEVRVGIQPMLALPTAQPRRTRLPRLRPKQPRKVFTDDEREETYRYHEDFPSASHREIAGEFGVERSTISKLLKKNLEHGGGSHPSAKHGEPYNIGKALKRRRGVDSLPSPASSKIMGGEEATTNIHSAAPLLRPTQNEAGDALKTLLLFSRQESVSILDEADHACLLNLLARLQ